MCNQPQQICFQLPTWVEAYVAGYRPTSDPVAQMAFVIGAARRNIDSGTGGPFAAAVFTCQGGELVGLGVNLVTTQALSILHAEMVAISVAQRRLDGYDLGASGLPRHRLVSSCEPCAMCFGAIPWSGVRELVTGARDADARAIGFDEGPKPTDWAGALRARQITVTTDVLADSARQVLKDYQTQGGHLYNSREP